MIVSGCYTQSTIQTFLRKNGTGTLMDTVVKTDLGTVARDRVEVFIKNKCFHFFALKP
jgi:hypothetical protein